MELFLVALNILILINLLLKFKFEKLTRFKDIDMSFYPNKFIFSYIFVGIFLFPFYKQIKKFRKIYYMENYIRIRDYENLTMGKTYNDIDDKYINYKRYIQIKKIQKRSKRYLFF